jgi:hypothetical protein
MEEKLSDAAKDQGRVPPGLRLWLGSRRAVADLKIATNFVTLSKTTTRDFEFEASSVRPD